MLENEYPISISPNGICVGDSSTYLSINTNMSSPIFNWSTGSLTDSILVQDTGTFSVRIYNSLGCSSSDTTSLIWFNNPFVDAGPDDTLCLGESKILLASGTASSYQWSNNIINGDTLTILSPQMYYVEGTNVLGWR